MVHIVCPISFSVFIFFHGRRGRVYLADILVFPFLSLFYPAHSLHFRDDTLLLSCLAHNITCCFAAVSSAMGFRRLDCSPRG